MVSFRVGLTSMALVVISCKDERGDLWISTNDGVSRFNPLRKTFQNYSTADGLPGPDLTGWGAGFRSSSGEMSFGGFSGATAFHPDRVVDSSYFPPIVLTDFRLSGNAVEIGAGSPLKKSISYASGVALSHEQNVFSLTFAALSYVNPATNRYRYKLEGLDREWNEVGSDRRLATYTTLPAGRYTFRATGRHRERRTCPRQRPRDRPSGAAAGTRGTLGAVGLARAGGEDGSATPCAEPGRLGNRGRTLGPKPYCVPAAVFISPAVMVCEIVSSKSANRDYRS